MKITACSIVKNEEQNIARSIESYKDAVDEIIIVDTGSTDNTAEICRKLGAKVFFFPWSDNFSAAKNYALGEATGEWILFLDADEWFVPRLSKKVLQDVLKQINGVADGLMTTMCEYNDKTNTVFAREVTTRIFRNRPYIRFQGAIHERLKKGKSEITQAHCPDIEIFHSGYANGQVEKKSKRNIDILYTSYNQGERSTALYYYLFRENYFLGNVDEAVKFYNIFSEQTDVDEVIRNNGAIVCMYEYMYRLMTQNRHRFTQEEIDRLLKAAYSHYPKLPIHSYLIGCEKMKAQDYPEAGQWLSQAIQMNSHYVEPFTNTFTAYVNDTYYRLGMIEQEQGNIEQAFSYYMEAVKGADPTTLSEILPMLLEIIGGQPEQDIILFLNSLVDMTKKANVEALLGTLRATRLHKVFVYYALKYNKEFDGQDDTTYLAMILMGQEEAVVDTAILASRNHGGSWHMDFAVIAVMHSKSAELYKRCKEYLSQEQREIVEAYIGDRVIFDTKGYIEYIKDICNNILYIF